MAMVHKRWRSMKAGIIAMTLAFTLTVMTAFLLVSVGELQESARRNLIQSTEFNLQLVAGLIRQDLDALDSLRRWCGASAQVADYLADRTGSNALAFSTLDRLSDEVGYNRVGAYLSRLIVTDLGQERFLQVGSAVSIGVPVTVYNLGACGDFAAAPGRWTEVVADPFAQRSGLFVLPMIARVYGDNGSHIGYTYVAVSTAVITDPLARYQIPEGGELFLTVGENRYRIAGSRFAPVPAPEGSEPTGDEVRNASTRVESAVEADGARNTLVSIPVGATGIVLSQSLPDQLIRQQKWLTMRLLLLLCAGVLLLGAAMALILSRMINRPVARIRRRLLAIAGGDFSPDPEIEWDNEFGDIGSGINQLSRDVASLMESRLQDEKRKRDLEYQMLQSQINPHFLYNTLNSIKWMATIQNAPGIAEMTTSLARLMKNIAKGDQKIIPLREELSLLEDYFVIQKYRYGGSLALERDIGEDVLDSAIPRFTLQPLVENAIFHGIEPAGGAGTVRVAARRQGEEVLVTVEDNGVGMAPETISRVLAGDAPPTSGLFRQIGLYNVLQRIRYDFGERYGLSVESEPGRYTRVVLRLPLRIPAPEGGGKESGQAAACGR